MLNGRGDSLGGKVCAVSGSGNVAQYTIEKLNHLGAKPVTLSDSDGFIYDRDGINPEKLAWVIGLKQSAPRPHTRVRRTFQGRVLSRETALGRSVGLRLSPSATQNELSSDDARILLRNRLRSDFRRRQHAF